MSNSQHPYTTRQIRTAAFSFALFTVFAGRPSASAGDWPFFRGPNRNGAVEGVKFSPADDAEIVWKTNLGPDRERRGSPVVANGKVYIHGGEGGGTERGKVNLFCLDASSGKENWKSEPVRRTDTAPAVDGESGRVYSFDDERVLRCFDAKDGKTLWTAEQFPESTRGRGWGHTGSPVLWEDLVLLNVGYGAAVSQETGKVVWHFDGFSGMATPVLFSRKGKPAVAIFCGDKLIARDARSGSELFSIPWLTEHGVNAADPLIFDNGTKVFLSSDYGLGRGLYDVGTDSPKQLWHFTQHEDHGGHTWNSAMFHEGHILGFTRDGLACIDPKDGSLRWRKGWQGYLLNLGGQFVVTSTRGELLVTNISTESADEVVRMQVAGGETWNAPAYWDGKLYSRNKAGDLFCAQIGK